MATRNFYPQHTLITDRQIASKEELGKCVGHADITREIESLTPTLLISRKTGINGYAALGGTWTKNGGDADFDKSSFCFDFGREQWNPDFFNPQ